MMDYFSDSNILSSYHCISKMAIETPIRILKTKSSSTIWLKCENEQLTGSFKVRGALNAVRRIDHDHIVSASAGNHGIGIAYASKKFNKRATIFLPQKTDTVRIRALEALGAQVELCGCDWDEANNLAYQYSRDKRAYYIHPFANEDVILGQSSLFTEFKEQVPNLDCVVMTSGGGGLVSGAVLANRLNKHPMDIISVEPVGAPTIHTSLEKGFVSKLTELDTIVSSVAVKQSSYLNYVIYEDQISESILVEDEDAMQTKEFYKKCMNQSIELSSAMAISAVLSNIERLSNRYQNIGVIICAKDRKISTIKRQVNFKYL